MREAMQQYVVRVHELAEHVRGNERATKQSLAEAGRQEAREL
jgi:hypothetical protein